MDEKADSAVYSSANFGKVVVLSHRGAFAGRKHKLLAAGLSQLECCLHNLWSFWLDLNIEGG